MAQKLYASNATRSIINKYKPLKKEDEIKWMEEYKKTKSDKSATALLNGISKVFANAINKNERVFLKTLPDATYDDIFNQMALMFFKKLPEFDPTKSKLNTWTTWQILPMVLNPDKTMRNKFATHNKVTQLDNKMSDDGDSFATQLPDGTINVESDWETGQRNKKLANAIKKLNKEEQELISQMFGYEKPKKEWQSKTGKINAASIARGMGISADRVRAKLARAMDKLKSELKQSNFDQYFAIDKLITQYKNRS